MAKLARVRPIVRSLLEASPAYAQLPEGKRKQIAHDMVRVASYMADPHGLVSGESRRPVLTRRGGRRSPTKASRRDGVDVTLDLVDAVDFPDFVAALIQGVFHAIVQTSIRQMEAFSKMLADVAKTVDAFRADGLTDASTRDDLASRFPDLLCHGPGARKTLRWCGDAAAGARILQSVLHLPEPPADMRQLVTAARRRTAAQRQQLLATMVLMGINRIVVTDGRVARRQAGHE